MHIQHWSPGFIFKQKIITECTGLLNSPGDFCLLDLQRQSYRSTLGFIYFHKIFASRMTMRLIVDKKVRQDQNPPRSTDTPNTLHTLVSHPGKSRSHLPPITAWSGTLRQLAWFKSLLLEHIQRQTYSSPEIWKITPTSPPPPPLVVIVTHWIPMWPKTKKKTRYLTKYIIKVMLVKYIRVLKMKSEEIP